MNIHLQAEFARILGQLRDPQRRSWIIMNPTSIGDTAIVCSLAREFVAQHGHCITLVVFPDHVPITQMFPNRFLRVVTADHSMMWHTLNNFIDSNRFELDLPFCAHPYDHGDCRTDALMYLFKFPGRGGLSLVDVYRYLLRLPWHARCDRPTIPPEWVLEAEALGKGVGMERGRSVVLFPANSTRVSQLPDVIWATLVARLMERGYRVFCNMKGGNVRPTTMPIVGTTPIEIPIHLALPLVSFAGRTVSTPNGMQLLTQLGGRFEHMTVMAATTRDNADYLMNSRLHSVTAMLTQYMCPEMCVDVPILEYLVPRDASVEESIRYAKAVADQAIDDPIHVRRLGSGGRLFVDEQSDWLRTLIQPVEVSRATNDMTA